MSAAEPRVASRRATPGVVGREDVAVVLVSHDGARWLPAVLDGIAAQVAPAAHTIAVDTGSTDGSLALLERSLGPEQVIELSASTSFPAALRAGVAHLDEVAERTEWIWVLHDDANPHPEALLALLAGTAEDPDADILGPMLREWPSLKRLLELGVTISATGRRETGLERGEYDQGQYSQVRPVLAVNTAGMLVRRSVLDSLGGLEEELPVFGNDLDFGWRAAAAGHRTVVVPQAVVFHVEAAHRGLRRTPLTGKHTHFQERRAALFTLLANTRSPWWPLRVLRLLIATLARMVGFALVRAPGRAGDDLAAFASVVARPRALLASRRARGVSATADRKAVEALLAPRWLPYRNALDAFGDLGVALTQQASDVAERRRAVAAQLDPSSFAARRTERRLEEEELGEDTGLVARFLSNPVAIVLTLVVLAALMSARSALGHVSGPGLSPAPEEWGEWWALHLDTWHAIGLGTAVPAPAYVAVLAVLATVLGASPSAAVSAVLLAAVPFSLWGAWRFLRVAGRLAVPAGADRWLILWGATTYALVPFVSGAWGQGRLSVVVSAALLPWLAHASLGFADPEADRRWRAAWRTGLLLALVTAFTPSAWLLASLVALVVVVLALTLLPGIVRDRSTWGPPLVAVLVVPMLLAPWWLPALLHGAGAGVLLDGGRLPEPALDGLDLALGRLPGLGAPWWLGAVLIGLAVLALIPRRTRIPVLICWMIALVAATVAAGLEALELDLGAVSTAPGAALPLVLIQAALVSAVVLGVLGLITRTGQPASRLSALVGLVAVLVAVLVPAAGLAWSLVGGGGQLTRDRDSGIPAYMLQSAAQGPQHGILVVRGSVSGGLTYTVRRDDEITTGEDEVLALTPQDAGFSDLVRSLVSTPTPAAVEELAAKGIEYVVATEPADGDVAAVLDATGGLDQASVENRSTRAWQVDRPLSAADLEGRRSWLRIALLVGQGIGLLMVLVLCGPSLARQPRIEETSR